MGRVVVGLAIGDNRKQLWASVIEYYGETGTVMQCCDMKNLKPVKYDVLLLESGISPEVVYDLMELRVMKR